MNALEYLIQKIKNNNFNETEIVISNTGTTFTDDDLEKLAKVINGNEWVKNNLRVILLTPNTFSKTFKELGLYNMNRFHVRNKNELESALQQLEADSFHYTKISFGKHLGKVRELNDGDLQELVNAINKSEWCQEHLEEICLANAHIAHLPSIQCNNLLKLSIFSNPIEDMEKQFCPNLRVVFANSISNFDIKSFEGCPQLEQINAPRSNLRVPPNVMPFANLSTLEVLSNNPFSPLGILALLLMQREKQLEIGEDETDLLQKFAQIFTKNPDFCIGEDFYEFPHRFGDNIDAAKFINEFDIPLQFFDDQVEAVVSFMRKIYQNVDDTKFKSSSKLENLKTEYNLAKEMLFEHIENLLNNDDSIETDYIVNNAMEICTEYFAGLETHKNLLLQQLNSDFYNLKDIFKAVGKPQHSQAIDVYVANNNKGWHNKLDVKQMLYEDGQQQLKKLLAPLEEVTYRNDSEEEEEEEEECLSTSDVSVISNSKKRINPDPSNLFWSYNQCESNSEQHTKKFKEQEATQERWRCIIS